MKEVKDWIPSQELQCCNGFDSQRENLPTHFFSFGVCESLGFLQQKQMVLKTRLLAQDGPQENILLSKKIDAAATFCA